MSARQRQVGAFETFAECFVLVAIGFFFGFLTCQNSTQTRYVRSLAEKHETESSYWTKQLDGSIQAAKGDIQKEKNRGK